MRHRDLVTSRARILQHAPSEGIGSIAASLEDRGATVTTTRFS